jgi:UDP-3-O-[3-hydroxymyristoyl] glucosamine N-acyltransferase
LEFTARTIAALLHGEIVGNPDIAVTSVTKIEEGLPTAISFLANLKYEKFLYSTKAGIVIVNQDFNPSEPVESTLIKVPDAYQAFAVLLEYYQNLRQVPRGIEQPCFVDATARLGENIYLGAFTYVSGNAVIGKNCTIYPNVFIGENAVIGDDVTLYPGVKIYNYCKVGNQCTIHSNTVIGADGFGFAPGEQSDYKKVPQTGNVVIEDHVEIGSNCSIDRATMGSTTIHQGVKLDNLIQIAHNVEIGENTVIAAQSGISGSTKIGRNCMIGGQVGIAGHLTISDNVKIAAQSGIGNNLESGEIVQGSPSFPIRNYQKSYVLFRNLPDIYHKFAQLEKELIKLKETFPEK